MDLDSARRAEAYPAAVGDLLGSPSRATAQATHGSRRAVYSRPGTHPELASHPIHLPSFMVNPSRYLCPSLSADVSLPPPSLLALPAMPAPAMPGPGSPPCSHPPSSRRPRRGCGASIAVCGNAGSPATSPWSRSRASCCCTSTPSPAEARLGPRSRRPWTKNPLTASTDTPNPAESSSPRKRPNRQGARRLKLNT